MGDYLEILEPALDFGFEVANAILVEPNPFALVKKGFNLVKKIKEMCELIDDTQLYEEDTVKKILAF